MAVRIRFTQVFNHRQPHGLGCPETECPGIPDVEFDNVVASLFQFSRAAGKRAANLVFDALQTGTGTNALRFHKSRKKFMGRKATASRTGNQQGNRPGLSLKPRLELSERPAKAVRLHKGGPCKSQIWKSGDARGHDNQERILAKQKAAGQRRPGYFPEAGFQRPPPRESQL
jgi:hypothetical protein